MGLEVGFGAFRHNDIYGMDLAQGVWVVVNAALMSDCRSRFAFCAAGFFSECEYVIGRHSVNPSLRGCHGQADDGHGRLADGTHARASHAGTLSDQRGHVPASRRVSWPSSGLGMAPTDGSIECLRATSRVARAPIGLGSVFVRYEGFFSPESVEVWTKWRGRRR